MPRTHRTSRTPYRRAVEELAEADARRDPDREFVRRIGAVLDELPQLSARRFEIVVALESVLAAEDSVHAMAGGPTALVAGLAAENVMRASARQRVLAEPMLSAEAVARSLGSRSVNPSQYASLKRRRSELLGIPEANRYLFPAFQIDVERRRIRPAVVEANRLLDAVADPWGVASWWFSGNARLGGAHPADLVGDEARADDLVAAARALIAPVG